LHPDADALSGADDYIVKSGGLAIAPKAETILFAGNSTQIERHSEFDANRAESGV
jgi:hypothetical protein